MPEQGGSRGQPGPSKEKGREGGQSGKKEPSEGTSEKAGQERPRSCGEPIIVPKFERDVSKDSLTISYTEYTQRTQLELIGHQLLWLN